MVIADLPGSDGAKVAKEMGENVTFAPTDVRFINGLYFCEHIW